jgi:hypothetical protein
LLASIWLADGSGAFTDGGADTTFSSMLVNLRTADIDTDEKVDLIAIVSGQDKLQLFAGNGNGTLDAPVAITGVASPNGFAIGDLDGDGDVDLLETSAAGAAVLLNSGNGGFAPPVPYGGESVGGPALADFTGDGVLDAAFTSSSHSQIAVRNGRGDGTFGPSHRVGTSFTLGGQYRVDRVFAADGDGDGATDDIITGSRPSSMAGFSFAAHRNACGYVSVKGVLATPVLATSQSTTVSVSVWTFARTDPQAGPSGNVELFDGATFVSTAVLDASGSATLTVAGLSVGTHQLHVRYAGDDEYDPKESAPMQLRVVSDSEIPTATLASSTNPRPWGNSTWLSGTVTTAAGAAASGNMDIYRDGVLVDAASAHDGVWNTPVSDSPVAVGTYEYRVRFRGGSHPPSELSAPLTVEVTKVSPSLGGSFPAVTRVGEPVQIELGTADADPDEGTVSLYDGAKLVGTREHDPNTNRYIFTVTLSEGRHAMTARLHDTATHAPAEFAFAIVSLPQGEVAIDVSAANGVVSAAWVGNVLQQWVPNFGWMAVSRASDATTGMTYVSQNPVPGSFFGFRAIRQDANLNTVATATDGAVLVAFNDEGLPKGTLVKAVHVTELVAAINTWRAAIAMAPLSIPNATVRNLIRVADVNSLCNGLNATRAATGMPPLAFPVLAQGAKIRANDVLQLRNALR